VLDNCEHLVPACAALAHRLLAEAGGLRVLTTSRQVLEVLGEHVYAVPPLMVDAPGGGPGPAVELFVRRAAAVVPGFALDDENTSFVVDVCRRLEGNPLAVELATVRLRVLSPAQLAERLHDRFRLLSYESRTRPGRQRTLRAAVDWSYDLLADGERAAFARLAAFAGGWTLEAAEAVCAGEIENEELRMVAEQADSQFSILYSSFRSSATRKTRAPHPS